MAATLTCRVCAAKITPPGGRAESVARCPWCDADLHAPVSPPPAATSPPPARRPPRGRRLVPGNAPADAPRSATGLGYEPVAAAAVLAVSAALAVGAFFAARHLMLLLG